MRKLLLTILYYVAHFIPFMLMVLFSLVGNLLSYISSKLVNIVTFLNNTIFGRTFVIWVIGLLLLFVGYILIDNAKNFHFLTDVIMKNISTPLSKWIISCYRKA